MSISVAQARRIAEEERFLAQTILFAKEVTEDEGRVVRRLVRSSYTQVESRLDNFRGFTFVTSLSRPAIGNDLVTVYFGRRIVLQFIHERISGKVSFPKLINEREWQSSLLRLMRKWGEVRKESTK